MTDFKWPVYKDAMLIVGNPKSQVGVCTLWTKKEFVADKLDKSKIAVIGNLYSPKRGIGFLLRNLLSNPNIRHLIVVGLDNSKSGQALIDFFRNGFEQCRLNDHGGDCWKITSEIDTRIDFEINKPALELLRKSVNIIDLRNVTDYSKINAIIDGLDQNLPPFNKAALLFPEHDKKEVDTFPSESVVHVVRGRYISEVWLKILYEIMRFGITDDTSYQSRQREIIDLTSVITDEDPENLLIPDWLPNSREHLRNYLPTILTGKCPSGASYTYGSRMRSYFGVDQIQKAAEELIREKYTRRAVINLLDPKTDCNSKNPPCLNHCWFRVQNDKLHLIATIRSNDMFEAWPENAFGLRMLQHVVFKTIFPKYPEIELGNLIIHSQSAHIYDDSWDDARNIIKKHLFSAGTHPRNIVDPRGNFLIKLHNDEIIVEHYSQDENLLNAYRGNNAMAIYLKISEHGAVSNINHAIYIGTELQKAEIALRLGIKYEQDRNLDI